MLTLLAGTAEARLAADAMPSESSREAAPTAVSETATTKQAPRYGPYARGKKYNVCRGDRKHCEVVKDKTYRGKYRCKVWAKRNLLRYKCRIKDLRTDGTGVYVAVKAFGTPYDDPEGWDTASGRVGPKGRALVPQCRCLAVQPPAQEAGLLAVPPLPVHPE